MGLQLHHREHRGVSHRVLFVFFAGVSRIVSDDIRSGAFTAVMNKKHAFLHRNAVLFNACASPLEDSDRKRLHDAGFRDCALDNCPDWIVKWAALTLDYVKMEEEILPQELMSLPPTAYGSYNELGAKFEAIGVASTRFTNLVVTLDKVRYVLNQSGQKQAPVFQVLTENEIIDHLWSGEQSIFRRFLGGMMSVGGSKRKRANETSEAFAANTGDARARGAALRDSRETESRRATDVCVSGARVVPRRARDPARVGRHLPRTGFGLPVVLRQHASFFHV